MREIKFRAWDVEKERWCTDETLLQADGSVMFSHGEDHGDEIDIQFWTGLPDKNGKEIWEGDICKMTCSEFSPDGTVMPYTDLGVMRWQDKSAKFSIECNASSIKGERDVDAVEVLGNIYESPEPLTPQKEKE